MQPVTVKLLLANYAEILEEAVHFRHSGVLSNKPHDTVLAQETDGYTKRLNHSFTGNLFVLAQTQCTRQLQP